VDEDLPERSVVAAAVSAGKLALDYKSDNTAIAYIELGVSETSKLQNGKSWLARWARETALA
jgi:hypothetical protein